MAADLDILRHKEWLGLLQPVGLVVSPPALIKAQAVIDRGRLVDLQQQLLTIVSTEPIPRHKDEKIAWIENFPVFTQKVLGWRDRDLVGASNPEDLPEELSVALPSYGETLRPTYAVRDPDSEQWVLLVQEIAPGLPFDEDDPATVTGQGWQASIQAKFERLLRETGVYAGLLVNGIEIRLVYAPKGESSGHLTFPVQAMTEVPGRLILGALDLLLGEDRLFNVPENQRLNRLLEESRNYQAEVSTKLSGQVLDALWELLRGFQAADAAVNGRILRELAETDPQHIYGGLIATLMRLVFLLYAEDEGLMPDDEVYQRHYAVSGLYEKLREDAGNYPDTMDQRYGAWATLLSLFRLVYDGGGPTEEYLPARHGQLFDPDEYPFLEGRPLGSRFATFGRIDAPRIADGVVYRMLEKLLVLDGERLSYRALDVEQIGSVYEAIMGYEVEIAHGRSIAVRPKDVVVDVDKILAAKPADRANILKAAECELKGTALKELKEAKTAEDIAAAIGRRVSPRTPNLLAAGSLFLQPGEERRRSGSHYTPRKLTQPIVEKTLEPVLKNLGEHPTPEQLLDLKVCDLAMGSAAFLVEACRQLADKLVEAWNYHGKTSLPSPLSTSGEGEQEAAPSPGSPSPSPQLERGSGGEVPSIPGYIYALCRQLRMRQTDAETLLWEVLRNRQFEGLKFRRQHPLGRYIADFYCSQHHLVIELDGAIHDRPDRQEHDRIREEVIRAQKLTILHFRNEDVEDNLEGILQTIYNTITPSETSPPSPLSTRGEGGQVVAPSRGSPSPSPQLERGSGGEVPFPPDNIDPVLYARRLVAQRCLYGVDKNPFAVNLARLSLWLVTLAKDLPFTFLDHALKCGDSLVGLTRAEIGSFGASAAYEPTFFEDHKLLMQQSATKALVFRQQIQSSDTRSDADAETKQGLLQDVERTLEPARLTAKVAVASFFAGENVKQRQQKREEFGGKLIGYEKGLVEEADIQSVVARLTAGAKAVLPFNWELEFPEVFERENPGFDAIVGNPPFAGKNTTINAHPEGYVDWLKVVHPESHGNADLVAHFFRRGFTLLRSGGTLGLIATNTIAQGDTRSTGLRFICNNGGMIYNATRRYKWPGLAAVVVSLVHMMKVA
jgi:very-short-patch-repair endonuclease